MSGKAKKSVARLLLHKFIWFISRPLASLTAGRKYNFTAEKVAVPSDNYLVLCNHVTHLDPFVVSLSFSRQMYFVASEHLTRHRLGFLIMFLFDPVLRTKSKTEANTAMEILRRLRAGCNVCMFIEGERTYDGCTEYIPDSAAHLAKLCNSTVVTYRLEQGYFTNPRWALSVRRAAMRGHAVNSYTPQQINNMTREEMLAHIQADLRLDAYAEQAKDPVAYRGDCLAENLETALFFCPQCGQIGCLHSRADRFWCDCGLSLRYTEYGYLESTDGSVPPFTTVRDWFAWQRDEVRAYAVQHASDHERALLCDEKQQLFKVVPLQNKVLQVGEGTLEMYCDCLRFVMVGKTITWPFSDISNVSCHEQKMLSFSVHGDLYEVKCKQPRSAVKYQLLFRALREVKQMTKEN